MDDEAIGKNWDLVKLAAVHKYLPDRSHAAVHALVQAYGQRVDTNCGSCILDMMERIYHAKKEKFGA